MLFLYVVPFLGDLPGGLQLHLLSDLVEFLLLVFGQQRTNLLEAVVTNFLELSNLSRRGMESSSPSARSCLISSTRMGLIFSFWRRED